MALAALAACVGAPQPAGPGDDGFPVSLRGIGTEPFWSLELVDGRAQLTTPEDQAGQTGDVRRGVRGGALRFVGSIGGAALIAIVVRKPCSDGMSDRVYPFAMTLSLGGEVLHGCGFDGAVPLPPE